MKSHICNIHFEADLLTLLETNFKRNACQLCEKVIETEAGQKYHIQNSHGKFDEIVNPMLDDITGSAIDRRKRKIKRNQSSTKTKKQKVKAFEESSTKQLGNKQINIEDSVDFKEIQSCIEFSDSESEDDEDDSVFNAIQNNIEFSDSDDD